MLRGAPDPEGLLTAEPADCPSAAGRSASPQPCPGVARPTPCHLPVLVSAATSATRCAPSKPNPPVPQRAQGLAVHPGHCCSSSPWCYRRTLGCASPPAVSCSALLGRGFAETQQSQPRAQHQPRQSKREEDREAFRDGGRAGSPAASTSSDLVMTAEGSANSGCKSWSPYWQLYAKGRVRSTGSPPAFQSQVVISCVNADSGGALEALLQPGHPSAQRGTLRPRERRSPDSPCLENGVSQLRA